MENFLLVGSGGREHAIADAICRTGYVRLYAAASSNNPGIMNLCSNTGGEYKVLDIHDPSAVVGFAKGKHIRLAFSSPDATLAAGVTDALAKAGIKCASPTKAASRLEWDKAFARRLMKKHKIAGCPEFGIFKSYETAAKFIDAHKGEVAIKPVGLTGGKGVRVVGFQLQGPDEAKTYAKELLASKEGKKSGVVIEEKLVGEEFTLQAFSDGRKLSGMPLVQDHKLAYEGDTGPNTGGMGSYSDSNHLLPFASAADYFEAMRIMTQVVNVLLKHYGARFCGVLYGQFMKTAGGVKVVEFNARFGDPEAMNVLTIFEGDLYSTFMSIADGNLEVKGKFAKLATVCKYLVPQGYPEKSLPDQKIQADVEAITRDNARYYFASVDLRGGELFTQKSRTMGIVGFAHTLPEAEVHSELACRHVAGPVWHRHDIGTQALIQKRVDHVRQLLGGK